MKRKNPVFDSRSVISIISRSTTRMTTKDAKDTEAKTASGEWADFVFVNDSRSANGFELPFVSFASFVVSPSSSVSVISVISCSAFFPSAVPKLLALRTQSSSVVLPRHSWASFFSEWSSVKAKNLGQKLVFEKLHAALTNDDFWPFDFCASLLVAAKGRVGGFSSRERGRFARAHQTRRLNETEPVPRILWQ